VLYGGEAHLTRGVPPQTLASRRATVESLELVTQIRKYFRTETVCKGRSDSTIYKESDDPREGFCSLRNRASRISQVRRIESKMSRACPRPEKRL